MAPGTSHWVISGYAVLFGGLLLLGGRAADRLGRRRTFMGGLALFALSSLVCGFAPSSELLVLARMVQGAAAAVMAPSALSIIVATFPEGRERNKALGALGCYGRHRRHRWCPAWRPGHGWAWLAVDLSLSTFRFASYSSSCVQWCCATGGLMFAKVRSTCLARRA